MLKLNRVSFTVEVDDQKIHLIEDATISIPPGNFMAIVGPSGCGKTTLLKIIAGLNEESSGNITWKDKDLSEEDFSPTEVGYVPQFSIAFDELTVSESIESAIRLRVKLQSAKHIDTIRNNILKQIGLVDLSDRRVKVLSGGQRRRLGLALELVTNPTLLLCDEVTSGLDPKSEQEIVRLMHSLSQESDRIVVNVTHSLSNLELYDTVLVLFQGRVAYQGSPSQLNHYFSVKSAEEIYPLLGCRLPEEWHDSWVKHKHTYLNYSDHTEIDLDSRSTKTTEIPNHFTQFTTLFLRRWKIFLRDRTQLLLQLAMLLGFPMLVVVFGLEGISHPKTMPIADAGDMIEQFTNQASVSANHLKIGGLISGLVMFQVILLTLMASNNSAREIAGERDIFEKERFGGLHTSSYIASKLFFLGILVIIQAVWMGIFVQILVPSLPGDILGRLLILILVTAAMTSICLGISGLMRTPEQASLMSIYLVGFQLPLSGAVLALPNWLEPFTRPFISAFWAWSGNLDLMKGEYFGQSINAVTQETSLQTLHICIALLVIHILVGIFAAYVGAKRHQW